MVSTDNSERQKESPDSHMPLLRITAGSGYSIDPPGDTSELMMKKATYWRIVFTVLIASATPIAAIILKNSPAFLIIEQYVSPPPAIVSAGVLLGFIVAGTLLFIGVIVLYALTMSSQRQAERNIAEGYATATRIRFKLAKIDRIMEEPDKAKAEG